MEKKKKKGREELGENKRNKFIAVRLTQKEFQALEELAETFDLTKADLIRNRVLDNSVPLIINKLEMIRGINSISSELGKSGSNLNQLAHHANRMRIQGVDDASTSKRLDLFFEQHNTILKDLHIALRSIIRKIGK